MRAVYFKTLTLVSLLLITLISLIHIIPVSGNTHNEVDHRLKKLCGDGFCETEENVRNCSTDCTITGFSGNNFGADFLWYYIFPDRSNNEALKSFSKSFSELGMEIARFDVYWGKLEPSKGVYDWTTIDNLLRTIRQDIPVLLTIYSANEWGSKYDHCREVGAKKRGVAFEKLLNRPPSSIPKDMDQYLIFLETLVKRYKDRIDYWQIENEIYGMKDRGIENCPPINGFWIGTKEEYVVLLKESYNKIKEIDPNSKVLISSIAFGANWPPSNNVRGSFENTLNYIFDKGKNYFDIVDAHLYGDVNTVEPRIKFTKKQMNSLGYNKNIWSTEIGEIDIGYHDDVLYRQSFDSSEELKLQSEENVKKYVLAFISGVDKLFRLKLNREDMNVVPTKRWEHMSLTSDDRGVEKRPAFYTNKLLIEKLKNFVSIEKIDEGIFKFNFRTKNPVYVLWSDEGIKNYNLSSYTKSKSILLTHIITELDNNGNPVYLSDEIVSSNSIPISEIPVFGSEPYVFNSQAGRKGEIK